MKASPQGCSEQCPVREERQAHTNSETPVIAAVDDDLAVCDSTGILLETYNFKVLTYQSAAEFLSDNPKISLLIVDFHIPGMNGLELVRELRNKGNSVPVLMITAVSDPLIESRAAALGIKGVLKKPLGKALVAAVQDELG